MNNKNKIKIYNLNKQDICNYLKYPEKLGSFNLTQGPKQIKNDIILKKLDILERRNKTRWLTYNTYIGSTKSFIFNPKFQIKTHFLKNKLKNQVFTGTFFRHLNNYNPYFFMSPDIYLKKRLQVLNLSSILHNHLKKYTKSKFFNNFTGKKKMVLLYLKKIELKKIIIAKIKKLYLPFFLHEENLKYKNFGFEQLQLKTNLKSQFDINKKNIYPVFVSQNLTKLNLSDKNLSSLLTLNRNFKSFDLINNLYKEKSFPLIYTYEQPFNENLKDLEFLRKTLFKKLIVKRKLIGSWSKEFKTNYKTKKLKKFFTIFTLSRTKKHIKFLKLKLILNSKLELYKEQLKKTAQLLDSLFSTKNHNLLESLDFNLENLKEKNKNLKQKVYFYEKLLNILNKKIKLIHLHLNNDFFTVINKFKKLKQKFLQTNNSKFQFKNFEYGSSLHEKSKFAKFSQETKLLKNLNKVFLVLKLIKKLKIKKNKILSLCVKSHNLYNIPHKLVLDKLTSSTLQNISLKFKKKVKIPKTIKADVNEIMEKLPFVCQLKNISLKIPKLTDVDSYLKNRKGRRILDGIIRNPLNPLGLSLLYLLTLQKKKKKKSFSRKKKIILKNKKIRKSSEYSNNKNLKVIIYFKIFDLLKKYALLTRLKKLLKKRIIFFRNKKIQQFVYLKDKKYTLSKLNKTNLRKKLVAKDIYHFFFHGLKFDRWDFDRWIPIPLV